MDFSLPSEFAKSALYYCPQFGQFICNSDYRIERNGIDQYLLIHNSGSLCIRTDGMTAEAHEGENSAVRLPQARTTGAGQG